MRLDNFSAGQVVESETRSNTPEKLAISLLLLLFSPEELQHGNCTKSAREDIMQLDTERLWAIKCKNTEVYKLTVPF